MPCFILIQPPSSLLSPEGKLFRKSLWFYIMEPVADGVWPVPDMSKTSFLSGHFPLDPM